MVWGPSTQETCLVTHQLFKIGHTNSGFTGREGVNVAIKSSGGGGDTIPGWVQAKPGYVYTSLGLLPLATALLRN